MVQYTAPLHLQIDIFAAKFTTIPCKESVLTKNTFEVNLKMSWSRILGYNSPCV